MCKTGKRKLTSRQINIARELAADLQKSLVEQGLHYFQSLESRAYARNTQQVKDGTHPFMSGNFDKAVQLKSLNMAQKFNTELLAKGEHYLQSDRHKAHTAERMRNLATQSLHPSQTDEYSKTQSLRMSQKAKDGTFNLLAPEVKAKLAETVECPHCGKTGQRRGMSTWHFNNCKLLGKSNE